MKTFTVMEPTTLYKIDRGSRAMGFDIRSSDYDYIVFSKCTREEFLDHVFDRKKFVNKHCKIKNDDVTLSNLFVGLKGIYNGNYAHLAIFSEPRHFGVDDYFLYKFVKTVAKLRMPLILKTMLKYNLNPEHVTAKNALQLLYNVSYADYVLRHGMPEGIVRMPAVLCSTVAKNAYATLMSQRLENDTENIRYKLEDEVKFLIKYRNNVLESVNAMPNPESRPDIETSICNYFLCENVNLTIPQ